ncbi:MAG: cytochrome c oxidase assembly protein [Clostridia bacterium]|nr:cytochrome c oxidase assembly protein [Clostridia bacterium]
MAIEQPVSRRNAANARTAISLAAVVCGMVGLSFASVPLYELFCRVTGFGGTTQVADSVPETISERRITVRFNADVNPKLPWRFEPIERAVTVHVGEPGLAFYRAENLMGQPISGTATFNVTPLKAGQYFNKVHCFCFDEQSLAAGEAVEMGVSFFIDPAILVDRNLDDVTTVTLSYTFFRDLDDLARQEEETASVADYQTTTTAN